MTTYDYIIVGAGSAGCVLANRLSADVSTTVCLLEAGPEDTHPFIHMPIGIIWLMMSRKLNWQYYTQPQAQLTAWEQLVQVLMLANEFMFID